MIDAASLRRCVIFQQQARRRRQARLLGPNGEVVPLPDSVFKVLQQVVRMMSQGSAISLVRVDHELTTQEAANLLNISRPSLIKLLDDGKLPYHRTGTHRRIKYGDLMAYRDQRAAETRQALRELVELSEEAGLYEREFAAAEQGKNTTQ